MPAWGPNGKKQLGREPFRRLILGLRDLDAPQLGKCPRIQVSLQTGTGLLTESALLRGVPFDGYSRLGGLHFSLAHFAGGWSKELQPFCFGLECFGL